MGEDAAEAEMTSSSRISTARGGVVPPRVCAHLRVRSGVCELDWLELAGGERERGVEDQLETRRKLLRLDHHASTRTGQTVLC